MPEPSAPNRQVFISYSSRNRRIAEAIRSHLESVDVVCWMAPESIKPGEQWAEAITRAIPESKLMVLLWTVESMRSEQVINELTLADRTGVMVLPFRVDEVEPEGAFRYYLYKTHWLDAFDGWKQKLGLLGERVVHNLGESPAKRPSSSKPVRRRSLTAIGMGQLISVGAAILAVVAAVSTFIIPKLVRQPAIVAGADETVGDQIAQCVVQRDGIEVINGSCRFRQFGGNGSFSLYPAHEDNSLRGGLTSLTLTVTSPGSGDVKGLVRNGKADPWGAAKQEALEQACWKGDTFRLCIYAEAATSNQGVALVFDPPSNIRKEPNGVILCSVTTKGAIRIQAKEGDWYRTDHCGSPGFINASQVRF